jgi:hypothetical protein
MFNNMKAALSTEGRTGRFTIYLLDGHPVLIVKPAGSENKKLFNAILAEDGADMRRRLTQQKISSEMVEKNRAQTVRLYPEHVVVGWENVVDDDGNQVPFSTQACARFFEMLGEVGGGNSVIDELTAFCNEMSNFVAGRSARIDAEALAGN